MKPEQVRAERDPPPPPPYSTGKQSTALSMHPPFTHMAVKRSGGVHSILDS